VREEKIDGRDCYVLESTPKTSKVGENSGYSKRVGWIDKINFIALQGEAYDLSGKLLKRFHSRDVQEVDAKLGRFQPMLLEADNVQSGHKTTLQFENFKANVGVGDEYFTVQYLEKP
jgi:outer membrane lipoprotein-sorting protein